MKGSLTESCWQDDHHSTGHRDKSHPETQKKLKTFWLQWELCFQTDNKDTDTALV